MLPKDFPSWKPVYYYFAICSKADETGVSLFDRLLKKLIEIERFANGKNILPSVGIIDSKSIKNADTAKEKDYDAGKKVSGIKLHIAVDTLGLPHAICVTCTNVTDRAGALQMISLNLKNLSCVKKFIVDDSYFGKNFESAVKEIQGAEVEVIKKSALHNFQVIPKRWIVEGTFVWLEKDRRVWKNCAR